MTREEILQEFSDINHVYNNCTRYDTLKRMLDELTEPKTGHWIGIDEEPHEDYECSCCGYVVSTFTANIEPHTEYKYCPNCGAKMESVV